MRKKTVQLVCDGCGKELEATVTKDPTSKRDKVDFPDGVSKVHVDIVGSPNTATLELCPDCTGQLPEGTQRKRPEPKSEEEKKAKAAAAKK